MTSILCPTLSVPSASTGLSGTATKAQGTKRSTGCALSAPRLCGRKRASEGTAPRIGWASRIRRPAKTDSSLSNTACSSRWRWKSDSKSATLSDASATTGFFPASLCKEKLRRASSPSATKSVRVGGGEPKASERRRMSFVAERRTNASETSIDSPCESDEYDSDSSLWGDSDDEWHDVPKGAFMSDAMARVLAQSRAIAP